MLQHAFFARSSFRITTPSGHAFELCPPGAPASCESCLNVGHTLFFTASSSAGHVVKLSEVYAQPANDHPLLQSDLIRMASCREPTLEDVRALAESALLWYRPSLRGVPATTAPVTYQTTPYNVDSFDAPVNDTSVFVLPTIVGAGLLVGACMALLVFMIYERRHASARLVSAADGVTPSERPMIRAWAGMAFDRSHDSDDARRSFDGTHSRLFGGTPLLLNQEPRFAGDLVDVVTPLQAQNSDKVRGCAQRASVAA